MLTEKHGGVEVDAHRTLDVEPQIVGGYLAFHQLIAGTRWIFVDLHAVRTGIEKSYGHRNFGSILRKCMEFLE